MEKQLQEIEDQLNVDTQFSKLQPSDEERKHTYEMAESISLQLGQMNQDLRSMVEKLNKAYDKSSDPNSNITKIVKTLNLHLNSLQWIDQQSNNLQGKVQTISKEFTRIIGTHY